MRRAIINAVVEFHTSPATLAQHLERFTDLRQPLAIGFEPSRGLRGAFVVELLSGEVLTVPSGYELAFDYVLNDAIHCPMCGALATCDPGYSPMLVSVRMKTKPAAGQNQHMVRAVCDACADSWSKGCDEFGDALAELRVRIERVWWQRVGVLVGELRDRDLTPVTGIISV